MRSLTIVLSALVACSTTSANVENDDRPSEPPAAVSSGQPPAEGDRAPAPPRTKYVSFIAESKEGDAPSLVSFENATAQPMTFWLGQIRFFAVKANTSAGPDAGFSTNVPVDAEIGVHQEIDGSCVKVPFNSYSGPTALVPGASYTMHVTPEGTSFRGVMTTTTQPFVAVRVELHDTTERAPGSLRGTKVAIDLGEPVKEVEFETDEVYRTGYRFAASAKRTASRVLYTEKSGTKFLATQQIDLSGAPGYTAIVDDKPSAGASVVVPLTEQKE